MATQIIDSLQYTDGQALSAQTNWSTDIYRLDGNGQMELDRHPGHFGYSTVAGPTCVDRTDVDGEIAIHATAMDSSDHTVEMVCFGDVNAAMSAHHGVLLRTNNSTADYDTMTGYEVRIEWGNSFQNVVIVRWNGDGTQSELANWDAIYFTGVREYGQARLTGSISGSTITAYLDGKEVGSTTDSTYSTGTRVGFTMDRIIGDVDAQPFVSHWSAWTSATTNRAYADVVQSAWMAVSTGVTNSITVTPFDTPTSGNLLLAFVVMEDDDDLNPPSVAVTDAGGTGSWTQETSTDPSGADAKIEIWSKTSAGDETTVTATSSTNTTNTSGILFVELPSAYSVYVAVSDRDVNVTTGTLSGNEKLLIAGGEAQLGALPSGWDWSTTSTISGLPERPLISRHAIWNTTADGFVSWHLHSLGTATTSQTVEATNDGFPVGTAVVVLDYVPFTWNLVATAVSGSQIDLTWNAKAGFSGYDIERDGTIIVFNHGTNSYNDTGLDPGTEYDYRVRGATTGGLTDDGGQQLTDDIGGSLTAA